MLPVRLVENRTKGSGRQLLADASPTRRTEAGRHGGVVDQMSKGPAEEIRPAGGYQQAGLTGNDDVRYRVDRGGNDGSCRGHCLDDGARQSLVAAGHSEYVQSGKEGRHVTPLTDK